MAPSSRRMLLIDVVDSGGSGQSAPTVRVQVGQLVDRLKKWRRGASLVDRLAASAYLAPTLSEFGGRSLGSMRELLKVGDFPWPTVAPKEVPELFVFEAGHPQIRHLYLLHPFRLNEYLTLAVAARQLAREKTQAFFDLLVGLGAKSLDLVSVAPLGAECGSNTRMELVQTASLVGMNAAFTVKGRLQRCLIAEYARPAREPQIPSSVAAWMQREPSLAATARARLDGGAHRVQVTLPIGQELDLHPGLVEALADSGLCIGGHAEQPLPSVWTFVVEFWSAKKGL